MNFEIVKSYIKNPREIFNDPDTLVLKEVLHKYPYFSTGYLLQEIAQNQKESIFTDRNIEKTAVYFGDRTRLYESQKNPNWINKIGIGHINKDLSIESDIIDKPKKRTSHLPNKKHKVADNLIDKFIQTNPSIRKPKAEFYSPTEMASRSLEDNIEFATETLAKIYLETKNYEKAIKIYQKLSLENPQKSTYFADLIKSLQDKINE